MIDFGSILPTCCARTDVHATSKKASLEAAAEAIAAAQESIDARQLLEALMAREKLGSTNLGDGIAIPHCRFADCQQPVASLLRLANPIGFDNQEVDLLFILVVPEQETRLHLDLLAILARVFDRQPNAQDLRKTRNDRDLYEVFQRQVAETLAE